MLDSGVQRLGLHPDNGEPGGYIHVVTVMKEVIIERHADEGEPVPKGDADVVVVDTDKLEVLKQLSPNQLALYNQFKGVFEQFIHQIAEKKKKDDISYWNGTFVCQWIKARDNILGREGYEDRDSLIALIARLNFDVDTIPPHIAENLLRLTKAIDEDPLAFTPSFVDLDQDDEIDLGDIQLIDEDYIPSDDYSDPE